MLVSILVVGVVVLAFWKSVFDVNLVFVIVAIIVVLVVLAVLDAVVVYDVVMIGIRVGFEGFLDVFVFGVAIVDFVVVVDVAIFVVGVVILDIVIVVDVVGVVVSVVFFTV